jgi:alpha-beta hydrolase superfamily lysophospholipase
LFIKKEGLGQETAENYCGKSFCDFWDDELYANKYTFSYGAMLMRMTYWISTYERIDFDAPVLVIAGRNDKLVDFKFTQEFYERIQAPEKRMRVFEDSAHEPLNDQNRVKFIEEMLEFLDAQRGRNSGLS